MTNIHAGIKSLFYTTSLTLNVQISGNVSRVVYRKNGKVRDLLSA